MPDTVRRAREGDADAFADLIERRQEAMGRLAMAILGDAADAGDALQEALVAIWRGLPGLRDAGRFDAWSDRIVVNACRLVLRRRARARVREVGLEAAHTDRGNGHGGELDARLGARLEIERAFGRLDADERAILVLHHLEQRPLGEIAVVLGVPVGTLKSRLHRARMVLERLIDAEGR